MQLDKQPLPKTWVIKHPKIAQFWIKKSGKEKAGNVGGGKWNRSADNATFYHSITAGQDAINNNQYLRQMGAYLLPVLIIPFDKTRRMIKARSLRIPINPNRGAMPEIRREPMTIISFRVSKNLVNMWKAYCARRGFKPSKAFKKIMKMQLRYEGREITPEKIML